MWEEALLCLRAHTAYKIFDLIIFLLTSHLSLLPPLCTEMPLTPAVKWVLLRCSTPVSFLVRGTGVMSGGRPAVAVSWVLA